MDEGAASFESDGVAIGWRRVGRGEPLILINGYAARGTDWDPAFLTALGRSSELICLDNRGVGDSELGERELTIELMARDVIALLDELGLERAPLLGWSMGGFVAQAAAAIAPRRVEALVLLASDHGGPEAVQRPAEVEARLLDRSGSPREQASRLIGLLFPPAEAGEVDERLGDLVAEARATLEPASLDAQRAAMAAWYREPADARLGAIGQPTLCAAGGADIVIPPVNTELLAARLPGSWRATFPQRGHAFIAQEPARVATLIGTFLDRGRRR